MKNILLLIILLCAAVSLSAQCLDVPNCPGDVNFCDLTPNNAQFWSETYWWDADNQTHDLVETPCDLSSNAVDTCAGASITVRYLLFFDLNGDGILETVIKSWDPPAPGTVNYDNYEKPN